MKIQQKIQFSHFAFILAVFGCSQPVYSDCPPDAFYELSVTNKMADKAACYLSRSDLVVRPNVLKIASGDTQNFDKVCSSYPYKLTCNVDDNSTNTLSSVNGDGSTSWSTTQGFTLDNNQLIALPTT